MPLKLAVIGQQMEQMAESAATFVPVQERFVEQAQALLRRIPADALCDKLDSQRLQQPRIPWLVASPLGSMSGAVHAPAPPAEVCVVGGDASSIAPDRHSSLRYYVLNVGVAALTYGSHPDARLGSDSQLCFRDEDLYLFPDKRDVPLEGTLLGTRMEAESLRALQRATQSATLPTVALRDGPLILWTLQNESELVQSSMLHAFLESMSVLQQASIPLGGYISFSDAHDVANSLRVWLCQGRPNACERCDSEERDLCMALAKIHDRELFSFLSDGQRSELFGSSSQILKLYGEHRVAFFYLNVGGEIARIETPLWVATDPALLGLLHAATYDQCRRSSGFPPYPPALLEAHEQAVITSAERRLVEEMVERAMAGLGLSVQRSAKDDSKRRRGV